MLIVVTEKHITEGTRRSPSTCPVALALRDAGFGLVRVDSTYIMVDGRVVLTPHSVSWFVEWYDNNCDCPAFTFDLPATGEPCR